MGSHQDFRSLQAKFQSSQPEPSELPRKPPKPLKKFLQPESNEQPKKPPQPEFSEVSLKPLQLQFTDLPKKPLQPEFSDLPKPPQPEFPKKPPQPKFADLPKSPQPEFADLPKKPPQPEFTDLPKKPPQPKFADLPKSPQPEFTNLPQKAPQPQFADLPKKPPKPEFSQLSKKPLQLEATPFPRKPPQPKVGEGPQRASQPEPSTAAQKASQPELGSPAMPPAEPKPSAFPKRFRQPEPGEAPLRPVQTEFSPFPRKPLQPQAGGLPEKCLVQASVSKGSQIPPLKSEPASSGPQCHIPQPGLGAFPRKPPQPEFGDLTRTASEPEVSVLPKTVRQPEFKALSKKPPQPKLGGLPRTSSEPEVSLLPRKFLQPEHQGPHRKFSQPEFKALSKKPLQPEFFRGLPTKTPLPGSVSESSLPTAITGSSSRFPLSPSLGVAGSPRWKSEDLGACHAPQRRPLPPASSLGPAPAKPPLPPGPIDIQSFRRPSAAVATAVRRTRSSAGTHFQPRQSQDIPQDPDEIYELYEDMEAMDDSSLGPSPSPRDRAEAPSSQQATRRPPQDPELRKEKAPQLQQLPPTDPKLLKQMRKAEKAEREFRKKFKFEGEIVVHTKMMIDPNAKTRRGGGKHLGIRRGEILEVIEFTNKEEMLCRDPKGKYGYVPRTALLPLETEVYDDVGFWDPSDSQPLPRGR